MTPTLFTTDRLRCLAAALGVLAAAALLAPRALALPVMFDGAGGYGISAASAEEAFDAGFTRLTPEALARPLDLGITIPEPRVLSASIARPATLARPTRATSVWTVNNGDQPLDDVWLVFLRPLTYEPPQVGIDLQAGTWGVVHMSLGRGEGSHHYFYPAVRLGDLVSGGYAQFQMNHVIAAALTQQGRTVYLPKYSVAILAGAVPEPGALVLLAGLVLGLALRRRGIA